ncbi:MAG TPA: DMT family transporter [Thermoplasmata archaeon]|jgi:drug/metabolite transporter (DMT)-like permease|nr:DMT family transporter [Thermoplasmata archaeon]
MFGSTNADRIRGVGLGLVLVTALVSGVSTFVNFYAVAGTNSDAFVTVRNLATAGLLVPVALVAGGFSGPRLRGRDWAALAIIGLVGGAIPFLLFFHGLALATGAGGAATASFVYRTLFLMASVFGFVFLRERISARWAIAAGLLLVGNVLLLSLVAPLWTPGTLYVLGATLLWAAEYTLSRRVLRDLRATTVGLGRMGFGAGFLVVYLVATAQLGAVGALSPGQWGWVAISALLLAAFVASWYAGLKRVDVGTATSVLVLGFPITLGLSLFVAGASFTVGEVAGALVVAAGVAVAIGPQGFRDTVVGLARRAARSPPA